MQDVKQNQPWKYPTMQNTGHSYDKHAHDTNDFMKWRIQTCLDNIQFFQKERKKSDKKFEELVQFWQEQLAEYQKKYEQEKLDKTRGLMDSINHEYLNNH